MPEERNVRTQIEESVDDPAAPAAPEETTDAPENTPDPTPEQPEPAPGGEGAPEPEATGEKPEAGAGADPEADPEEQPAGVTERLFSMMESMQKRMDDLASGKVGSADPAVEMEKEVLLPEFTPDMLAKLESDHDISPKQANVMRLMMNQMGKAIVKQIEGSTAGYRKDTAMAGMINAKDGKNQPKYPGIGTPAYRQEMDGFLKDYSPTIHSRPDILERAYWFAHGKLANKKVEATRKGKELSRTIAGRTALANPGGGKAPGAAAPVLSASQKAAAGLHPGGIKGYIADLQRRGSMNRSRVEAAV